MSDEPRDDASGAPAGRFRINLVSHLTGVPEATLRAWERRYQVPKPARTPSGYRVYSARDVALVRRMNDLCSTGVSPNEAAAIAAAQLGESTSAESRDEPLEVGAEPAFAESSEVRFVEVAFPESTNHYGTVFGGHVLAWMDKAAFVAATRFARCPVVTASSERVDFHTSIRAGQIVEVVARVVQVRRSSMTIEIDVISEELLTGERLLATRGRFHMVAVDQAGRPVGVRQAAKEDEEP